MPHKNNKKEREAKLSWEVFLNSLKIIRDYIRPHRTILTWLAFFSVLGSMMEAFVPYLSGKIIDQIIAIAQGSKINFVIFELLGLWFVARSGHSLIDWRAGLKNEQLSEQVYMDYMSNGLKKLLKKPVDFHKEKERGKIWEKFRRASVSISRLIRRFSIQIIPAVLTFIVAIVITFTINSVLAGVLVGAVILYTLILWRSVPQLAGLQREINEEYGSAFSVAHDALDNIQEVKQNATEEYEQERIKSGFVEKAMPVFADMQKILYRIDGVQRILIVFSQLTIFCISIYFVQQKIITPGELVAFNGYAAMMFSPFIQLGQSWQAIQNGVVDLNQAQKILKAPSEEYQPERGFSPQKLEGRVEFKDVSFSYKEGEVVLKNISFEAQPGQNIALVGESGVGKSTLVSLILALNLTTEGEILVDGNPLEEMNLKSYRSRVGVVNQEPTLFNDTVKFNIKYGSFQASQQQIEQAAKQAHAHEFITDFPEQYQQTVGWKGIKLSIGQKQRVSLARAFLQDPDLLILDEPTSALDAESEHFIKESLKELMANRTTFIIAHRLSTIREADEILVLDNHKLVEKGTHEQLVDKEGGVYKQLYDYQIGMYGSS